MMPRHIRKPTLSIGSRRRLLLALAVTFSALLSLAAPAAHAQDPPHHWGGRVEVDTNWDGVDDGGGTLVVDGDGGSLTYRIRLSEQPTKLENGMPVGVDGWWIVLRVDGGMRADGDYNGITWVPSVGWEFTKDNWNQWRTITINGGSREGIIYDGQPIRIEHEVWDHETNCPFKGSPLTVDVVNRPPALTVEDVTVEEGDTARLHVRLSKPSSQTVTVSYATANGSATAPQDYTTTSDTLTFAPGVTSQTISVPTTDDGDQEPDESFTVRLSNPGGGANIARGTATVTINDNDTVEGSSPALSIANAAASEGDPVVFTVTLTGSRTANVTVQYDTADGSATDGVDYTGTSSGTLTFPPADTTSTQTISVPTIEDTDVEGNETFTVTLSNAGSGVTIQNATATGTINDDDGGPPPPPPPPLTLALSIEDAEATEGDPVVFTVTLTATGTGTRTEDVTVAYATADGSADDASDYTDTSDTLTFSPTEEFLTISVPTTEDTTQEDTETFTVTLSSPSSNATIDDGTATGTINDDDDDGQPPTLPTLSIEDAAATEGDPVEFTVSVSGARTGEVTVTYETADGTAQAASDYTAVSSATLTFAANESSKTISIETTEDTVEEETETFTVTLSSPVGATIDDGTATGTINDDDDGQPPTLPTLSIEDAAATEGDPVEFTVSVSGARTGEVTVTYETADGTAQAASDYTAVSSATLTFAANESSKTISIETTEDTVEEETETFTVTLSSPVGATIDDGTATGTINDDDDGQPPTLPTLSIEDAAATEGDPVDFTVTVSGARTGEVTVTYETADGTALAASDYTAVSSTTLTFAANESSKTISIETTEDTTEEETETFTVTLSSPVGATIADGTATGTINDDDGPVTPLPTLTIEDATVEEGGAAAFEVTLSAASDQTVTVAYATADGTALRDDDYTEDSGTLTFAPGEVMMTIAVQTTEDSVEEDTETFTVTLSSPNNATIADGTATGTITDDDGPVTPPPGLPTLSIKDATVEEGGTAAFEVALSAASDQTVTVAYATADGTALKDDDYTEDSGALTFAPGEEMKTISVRTTEDTVQEDTETFTVSLSSPGNATIADGTATGTITDDDGPVTPPPGLPTLSIKDATVEEGGTAAFEVALSAASDQTVTVAYATADGTALKDDDYTEDSGALTFAPGEEMKTISVRTTEDTVQEDTETFTVSLSSPGNATIADGTATGTITDDDGPVTPPPGLPTLSIADATVEEGGAAAFGVTLSAASDQTVTVAYATADGTALRDDDYTEDSGTLTFAPGEVMMTIAVQTTEDSVEEDTETFTVTLSSPNNATIADGTATGTITDDDGPVTPPPGLPTLSIADATVEEGGAAAFEVTLSAASDQTVTVAYATADGTALKDDDYTEDSGTLTFAPGEVMMTIAVQTTEDSVEEDTETFTVTLSSPGNATIADGTATGTITDDDGPVTPPPGLPTLSIKDATVEEGGAAAFGVTLSAASDQTVTVAYATADGTALKDSDYAEDSGTLTFAPGEVMMTISVRTTEDTIAEETETFTVTLSSPGGATIADGAATGTITDDDGPVTPPPTLPTLSIEDATVEEGGAAAFGVTLSAASDQTVTVAYATADGTALKDSDYAEDSGTLTFAPGEVMMTISVRTTEDTIAEETETFTVTLSSPGGATIADGAATGTITDDDGPVTPPPTLPTLSIGDTEATEGDMAEFLVTLRPASDAVVTVAFRTMDGTAVAGLDYTATLGTLRFEPGETSATIAVATLTDEMVEGAERFTMELGDPVGATVSDGTGVGTITDDHRDRIGTVNRTVLPEVGRALAFNAVTCRFDRTLSSPMAAGGTGRSAGSLSLSPRLFAGRRASPADPWGSPADPWSSPAGPGLTFEQALGDSSFLMPSGDGQGGAGRYTAWGCADYRHLSSAGNGGLSWNGVAFSAQVGADVELGANTLAGVSVSRSRSSFGYYADAGGDQAGANELRLTGVHPYLAWSASPDLVVWGTVGHAWGDFQVDDHLGAGMLRGAAALNAGSVGVNGRLLGRGGTEVRVRGEGGLAQLGIAGNMETLGMVDVDLRRLRLAAEASHEHLFPFGSTLTPWAEVGLRHDGGDGETGAGLEIRAGLRYRDLPQGLTIEGYGRRLVVHAGTVRESGFGAVLRVDPGESGLGPSLSLTPAWGATASGVHQLWERGANAFSMYDTPGGRMNAQFAYGLPALDGAGLLTPFGALSLAGEQGRGYGLGATLAVGRRATVSLEAERRRRLAAKAIYAVMLRGMLQF